MLDLGQLGRDARLALVINLYNMMVLHAFVQVGIPETALDRNAFFNSVCYSIGGL